MVAGFLPPHSVPAREQPVEVINPTGKKTVLEVGVNVLDQATADVIFSFPGLKDKDLENMIGRQNRAPKTGDSSPYVQILKILNRRGGKDLAVAEVRLQVEVRESSGTDPSPLCFYKTQELQPGDTVSLPLTPEGQRFSADVVSAPKRIQKRL